MCVSWLFSPATSFLYHLLLKSQRIAFKGKNDNKQNLDFIDFVFMRSRDNRQKYNQLMIVIGIRYSSDYRQNFNQ